MENEKRKHSTAAKGPYELAFPACRDERTDCNRRTEDGKCDLLTDTVFRRGCPFYRSREEAAAFVPPTKEDARRGIYHSTSGKW